MRLVRMLYRLSAIALPSVALLGLPAPSHAYRMAQSISTTQANWVQCDDMGGFAHWNGRNISWHHNTSLQGAGKAGALMNALQTWTDVAESDYTLSYAGTTTAQASWDGLNTFWWQAPSQQAFCDATSCHAITILYMDAGQVITESDIVFNDAMSWRTDGSHDGNCLQVFAGMALDTWAIATHELGHALGIGHTEGAPNTEPYASATMGQQSCSVEGRSPSPDDIEALMCAEDRYPFAPSYEGYHEVATCDSISGWAWNANRPYRPSYVEILDNGNLMGVVAADIYRSDLAAAGKGDGEHAFWSPSGFGDGERHTITIRHSGTAGNLSWTGQELACNVSMFPGFWPDEVLSTGGQTYTVGTQFYSERGGKVTHLRYFRARGETGTSTIRLWNDAGTSLLASVQIGDWCNTSATSIWPGRWCSGEIVSNGVPAPVTIQANTYYRVSVETRVAQAKSPCSPSSPTSLYTPISRWPLTAQTAFWSAGDTFPTTNSCSNFFVDVAFDTP